MFLRKVMHSILVSHATRNREACRKYLYNTYATTNNTFTGYRSFRYKLIQAFCKYFHVLGIFEYSHQMFFLFTRKLLLVFSVTPIKVDQNKNQNRSIDKVQNLGNERWWCSPGWAPTWRTKTNRNICYRVLLQKREFILRETHKH